MKNKFLTVLSVFLMLILIASIVIFGFILYLDLFASNTENEEYKINSIATEEPEDKSERKKSTEQIQESLLKVISKQNKTEEEPVKISNSKNYFFGQLENEYQRKLYMGLEENKNNLKKGDYIINYGASFSDLLEKDEGSEQLGRDYQTAIEAFTHDNPDLFFLDVNKMYLNIEKTTKIFKTTYNVYISAGSGENYLLEEFQNISEIEEANLKIERIRDDILANLNGNEYQKVLYIHDCLVDNIEYDTTYKGKGAYSIYGALIEKKCVCEGYTKAFKYIANAAGIDCEMMQGIAVNSSGQQESHAWNCVKVDGSWYEIDCTWDDPIIIGNGKLSNSAKYKFFLKSRETFEQDHKLSYQFSDNGKVFKYPEISTKDY